jgi:uncharacterized membrane protein (UPF0127 family)
MQNFKNKVISTYLAHPVKIIFIIIGFAIFGYYLKYYHHIASNFTEVKINNNIIYAQIADTENERSLGLSYTKQLDLNAGMLFIFPTTSVKNFWMRDRNYNLDIIWVDENKTVVGFQENADKNSYNKKIPEYSRIYRSPENTKFVLEVATNTIQTLKIKTGDVLDFRY